MKFKLTWLATLFMVFAMQFSYAQETTISGNVSSVSDGLPLPGVNVIVKGTTTGVQTDFDGNYSITANIGDVLAFSYVGLRTVEQTIGTSNTINVIMEEASSLLEEIVVVAYGTKKRGVLSSSVSTLSSLQIEKQNNSISIDNALQGVASGVQVVAQNGKPGNAAFVRIRGVGSINAGSEPLYLLDGIPVNEEDIIGINPSDVSSMSVLKDAASTAIYGARGANGVVIITTKTGTKDSGAVFRFTSRVGISEEIKKNFRVMNAREKLEYERAIGVGVGAGIVLQSEWDELIANDHDWSDDLFKTSHITSLNFSVSGGEDKLSYFMSVSNDSDSGIIELIEKAFERTSARVNIDYDARDWLTLSTKLSFSTSQDQDPRDRNNIQNPVSGRYTFNPYEPIYRLDDNGDFILNLRGLPTFNPTHQGLSSFAQVRANQDDDTDNRWFGAFSAGIKLHENLQYYFGVNGSYIATTNRHILHAGSALDLIFSGTPTGRTSIFNSTLFTRSILNRLTYNKLFNDKHDVTATVIIEYNQADYENSVADGDGFVVNGPTVLDVASNVRNVDGFDSTSRLFSLAASLDYVYDGKYILNATVRRDGSSIFGANTKYGVFWGASAAWNVHQEKFFQPISNVVSELKLRLSAGTTGNNAIGTNNNLIGRNPSLTAYGFSSYNGQTTSAPSLFGDPNLGWEESFTTGAGLEFGLFNSRVTGVVDYYKKETTDLLLNVPISLTQGGGSILKNIGEVENTGWEFELRGDVIRSEDFRWNVGLSLSLYDNEVTQLADDNDLFTAQNNYTGLRVGEKIHTFYIPRYAGVNPANGQALFLDTNGDLTNTNDGGEVFLSGKSPYAKFDGGINTSITYKGFYLNADLYYKGGNYIFNTVEQQLLSDGTGANSNQRVDAFNYWKNPGDLNVLPDPTANNSLRSEANGTSTRYLQKGDYIRLRNLQIGYDVPSKFLENVVFSQIKVYVSATNLWTYTPYYKGDPEVGIGSAESNANNATRVLIPGEFSLNSYPTTSSYMFGVDIKF